MNKINIIELASETAEKFIDNLCEQKGENPYYFDEKESCYKYLTKYQNMHNDLCEQIEDICINWGLNK